MLRALPAATGLHVFFCRRCLVSGCLVSGGLVSGGRIVLTAHAAHCEAGLLRAVLQLAEDGLTQGGDASTAAMVSLARSLVYVP